MWAEFIVVILKTITHRMRRRINAINTLIQRFQYTININKNKNKKSATFNA